MTSTDGLERLLAEATPLPWFVGGVRFKMNGGEWHGIMSYNEAKKQDDSVCLVGYDPRTGEGHADARLICAAVNALPELLARLERYDDALDEIAAHYNGGITGPGRLQADSMRDIARAALKETGSFTDDPFNRAVLGLETGQ